MRTLFIVSTPIGNFDDITIRAKNTLSTVDIVLAEDTRRSGNLLKNLSIKKPLKPYHDFNKEKVTPRILKTLEEGKDLALITDAGTPGIADPAFYLIRAAINKHITVIPIPGASALLAAFVGSGLPMDRFIFENFLPSNSTKRKKIFESLLREKRTIIFYETPHRIVKVLKEMDQILGDVYIVVARELTKLHEEFIRGTPKTLLEHFSQIKPKGEMVVLFNSRIKRL